VNYKYLLYVLFLVCLYIYYTTYKSLVLAAMIIISITITIITLKTRNK